MGTYYVRADRFFLPAGQVMGGCLEVTDGRFGTWQDEAPEGAQVVDLTGTWVAPGFVDTHIHGYMGHAANECDPQGLLEASQALAARGTTSWLPSTFTESVDSIEAACAAIREAAESRPQGSTGARIQGIFLEGPFFTQKHVGAQNPAFLIDPSYEAFSRWQEAAHGLVRRSALAPEREGSAAYIARLAAEGVATAIGHTDATYAQCLAAVNAGATTFVHTYNGMRGLHHREPGVVGCAMATRDTVAELICDGHHVSPGAVAAMVNAKGWQHVALISDCLGCGGLPEGEYTSGGLAVVMRAGVCYLRDQGNIAGSTIALAQAVKNLVDWGVATPAQAVAMATVVSAQANHIDQLCGSILPGRDADFVALTPAMEVRQAYVGGVAVEA